MRLDPSSNEPISYALLQRHVVVMDWSPMRDTGLYSCVTAAQSPVNKLSFRSTRPRRSCQCDVSFVSQRILGKGVSAFWFAICKKCLAVSRYFWHNSFDTHVCFDATSVCGWWRENGWTGLCSTWEFVAPSLSFQARCPLQLGNNRCLTHVGQFMDRLSPNCVQQGER